MVTKKAKKAKRKSKRKVSGPSVLARLVELGDRLDELDTRMLELEHREGASQPESAQPSDEPQAES